MAVSATNLTNGEKNSSQSSASTASITPTSNSLVLLACMCRNGASTNPTTPSISGNGLTWELINSCLFDNDSTSRRKIFLFRAMGASPSAGAVTITWGETETNSVWSIDQFTGVDTSGSNGSGAIVQSAIKAVVDLDTPVNPVDVTLSAFGDATNNAVYGVASEEDVGVGFTVDTGYTQLAYPHSTTSLFTQWKIGQDTTVSANMNGSYAGVGGIAVEIKAAATSTVKTLAALGVG